MNIYKTYWFNLLWDDGSESERFTVQLAPDRDTALRMAAVEILVDERKDPEFTQDEANNLLDWIERTFTILSEGEGMSQEGISGACPNCTSHNTHKHGWRIDALTCHSCGFDFIPLGFVNRKRTELEREAHKLIQRLEREENHYFNPFE